MTKPGEAVLVPVLRNHRFDEAALLGWLERNLPGFRTPCEIRQFQGGQSNPTFHLQTPDRAYVVRKKPPGVLLPSAHAVDREYTVQKALAGTGVPVPKMHLLCTDESVIGTMFYVMDHVPGRVFRDPLLPGCEPADRAAMFRHMAEVLAKMHGVDFRAVGLESFGKPEAYIARQVSRWSKQYVASRTEPVPEMDELIAWLASHIPAADEAAIAHGDYRPGNLVFHPTEPRVVAVLDWELSTIGHPLGDLAYNCLAWRLSSEGVRGFGSTDIAALGIPSEAEYLALYRAASGRKEIPNWEFFVAFAMFRISAILVGVYRRGLDGNASDARAVEAGAAYRDYARQGWDIARRL